MCSTWQYVYQYISALIFSGYLTALLGAFAKLRKATISIFIPVRLSVWNNSVPTGYNFTKFDIWVFFENLSSDSKYHRNRTKMTGAVHKDQYIFCIVSRSFLLRMKNISDRVVDRTKTHILYSITCFRKSFLLWDKVEKYCGHGQTTDDNKAHTHSMLDN